LRAACAAWPTRRAHSPRSVDMFALQEVRASAVTAWQLELEHLGYRHRAFTLPTDGLRRPPDPRLGVLIAGRQPVEVCPPLDLPWPERHLAVRRARLARPTSARRRAPSARARKRSPQRTAGRPQPIGGLADDLRSGRCDHLSHDRSETVRAPPMQARRRR
jgi:hypothetical protein